MKKRTRKLKQPQPFTPGVTQEMVRKHAFTLYRSRLLDEALSLEDWVLAEKDLVQSMSSDGLLRR